MILHETSYTFRDAIRAASDHLGIRDVFVEKDYWVTYILKSLSESEYSQIVVFKGGTSLSKVYNVKKTYNTDFKLLVHGEFPDENLIAEEFKAIIEKLVMYI